MSHTVILCLGGNMGDRAFYIYSAISEIKEQIGNVKKLSNIYETEAWGVENQQAYLNCCIEVKSSLTPFEVLNTILTIEKNLGRERNPLLQYDARTIDIDVLFYNNDFIDTETLMVPHPRLHMRKFVLMPLNDIEPNLEHPILKLPITYLLQHCSDKLNVKLYQHTTHVH